MNPLALIPLKVWLAIGVTLLAGFILWRVHNAIYGQLEQAGDAARRTLGQFRPPSNHAGKHQPNKRDHAVSPPAVPA